MADDSKVSSFKRRAISNHPTENYDSLNPGSPPNSSFSIAVDSNNQNITFENKKFI